MHQGVNRGDAQKRAMRILERTLRADNSLVYRATYSTTAIYGEHRLTSSAHLERAPKRVRIRYLSGARKGLELGFNERWFWRRDGDEPMQAYAEVALRPDEMVQRRFAIMRRNYGAHIIGTAKMEGLVCDVIEVRRLKEVDGAVGPWKRLWIERQNGLTLRTDSYNHKGELVMRSQLSRLEMQRGAQAPAFASTNFVVPSKMVSAARKEPWMFEEMNADHARVQRMTGIASPHIHQMPQGFQFDSVGTQRLHSNQRPCATLTRLTDGLNVLTVFALTNKTPEQNVPTACNFGMGSMAMRELPNGVTLLAVGDLPMRTLEKVLANTSLAETKSIPTTTSPISNARSSTR